MSCVVISILSVRGIIGFEGINSRDINFGWFSCKLLCTLLNDVFNTTVLERHGGHIVDSV